MTPLSRTVLAPLIVICLTGCELLVLATGPGISSHRCPITLSTDRTWTSIAEVTNFEEVVKDGSIVDLYILHRNGGKGTERLVVAKASKDEITGRVKCSDTFKRNETKTYHRAYIQKISVIKYDN